MIREILGENYATCRGEAWGEPHVKISRNGPRVDLVRTLLRSTAVTKPRKRRRLSPSNGAMRNVTFM